MNLSALQHWSTAIIELPLLQTLFGQAGSREPLTLLALFLAASGVMVWRLNAMENRGFEGTLVGTLIMPYCSGFANLAFAFVLARSAGPGRLVLENCIVNNVTNLTLILGIPALLWGLTLSQETSLKGGSAIQRRLNHLSVLLTLIALIFFTAILWLLAMDGVIDRNDGAVLVGIFFFWQMIHVIEVMKTNVRKQTGMDPVLWVDFAVVIVCAWVTLHSIDGLVAWTRQHGQGLLSERYLGMLSGFMMVVPNAMLAFYYAARNRTDVVYSSQIGDCHICIPLCVGLFAMAKPIVDPGFIAEGLFVLLGAACLHLLYILVAERLPRIMGGLLILAYAGFFLAGLSMLG